MMMRALPLLAALPAARAGACTADDVSKIGALPQDTSDGSFGAKSAACGKKAYSLISGFDTEKFDSCLMGDIAVGHDCADCYAQAGKYSAANCKADCLLGWCKSGCLDCAKSATDAAATCSGVPTASIAPCDALEVSVRGGACSADDVSKIGALPQDTSDGSFGAKSAACGKKAFSLISGFDTEKFDSCLVGDIAVSHDCADCYAQAGKYSAANCKADCLFGWCKSGCLDCAKSATDTAATCSGVPTASFTPCDALEVSARGGACTADDLSKIGALPQDTSDGSFGAKSATCGKKAFSLISGFDTEKFDSCLMGDIAVSHDCADCYAQAGKYSAANCKADCLLGWCKSGCLDCSKSATDAAATCSGVPTAPITPCEEVTV